MDKLQILRYYLGIFGVLSIVTSIVIPLFFPHFLWSPRNIPQEVMISSISIATGLVMIVIARNPANHKSFIDFVIIVNLSHAGVMVLFAENIYHLAIDSAFVGLMGILPLIWYPWKLTDFLKYSLHVVHIVPRAYVTGTVHLREILILNLKPSYFGV